MMKRLMLTIGAMVVSGAAVAAPFSQAWMDAFKASAAKTAADFRNSESYKRPACDIDTKGWPVVIRSHDPLLHQDDQIVAVNGRDVHSVEGGSSSNFLGSLPPSGTVRITLVRKKARMNVSVSCTNSAERIGLVIAAYDAAAAGKFAECAEQSSDYAQKHLQRTYMYSLWRKCSILAGQTTGEAVHTTFVRYWTLRLQELRYDPRRIEEIRPQYLGALQELSDNGQSFLVEEMRRQWALATGEPNSLPKAPPPPTAAAKSVPQSQRAPRQYIAPRSSGSSCEDGHWIEEVMGDGAIIKLEDGSLWRVDDADTVDSALWLATTEIVVCDGKLINTDDNESVEAERIR